MTGSQRWEIAWSRLEKHIAREERRLEKEYEDDPHGTAEAIEVIAQVREAMGKYEPRAAQK